MAKKMTKGERQRVIIDATKSIIANDYIDQFTIRFITQKTGINEALVYRDFATKEGLLFACYKDIVTSIHSTWEKQLESNKDENPLYAVWSSYFSYLLQHQEDAIFLFNYRQSSFLNKDLIAQNFKNAYSIKIISKIEQYLPPSKNPRLIWSCLLDTTLYFGIKVIKKELPYKEEKIKELYDLINHGMNYMSELDL